MITTVPALGPPPASPAGVSVTLPAEASSAPTLAGSASIAESAAKEDFQGANGAGSLASATGEASDGSSTAAASSATGSSAAGSDAAGSFSGVGAVPSAGSQRVGRQLQSADAGSGSDWDGVAVGSPAAGASSPNSISRIDFRGSGAGGVAGGVSSSTSISATGASASVSLTSFDVSVSLTTAGSSSSWTTPGSSVSVAALSCSVVLGVSWTTWPKGNGSEGASPAGSLTGLMASADGAGCGRTLNSGGAPTGGTVGGGAGWGGVAPAGGCHPVGGRGSLLVCTIFSRFSRTLKLKRRRFGFPRRPASCAAGSGAGPAGGLL